MLKTLYIIAFFFLFFLIFVVLDIIIIPEKNVSILAAIGIIISAFIASFSILKSIDENKKIQSENRFFNESCHNELYTLRMEEMKHVFISSMAYLDFFENSDNKKNNIHYLEFIKNSLKSKYQELSDKDLIRGLYANKRLEKDHGLHIGKVSSFVMMRDEIFDALKIIDELINLVLEKNPKIEDKIYKNYCGSIKIRLYAIKGAVESSFGNTEPLRNKEGKLI